MSELRLPPTLSECHAKLKLFHEELTELRQRLADNEKASEPSRFRLRTLFPKLEPKGAEVLLAIYLSPPVISEADLKNKVWGRVYVSESLVKVQIYRARKAIGEGNLLSKTGLGYYLSESFRTTLEELFNGHR
jgi:DNA-binding response OmpR family regulator